MKRIFFLTLFALIILPIFSQTSSIKLALLKYHGGGDWYANPTALPNLIKYCNKNLGTNFYKEHVTIESGSSEIFNYPFVHATGHGNIIFSMQEVRNLRTYMLGGGFIHFDDNYGMDKYIRRELKKIFPEYKLIELSFSHPLFHQKYNFSGGLPKIHEHDDKPAQAYGIFHEGRMVCLYTSESDLGDGWEDQEVHNDSEETRTKALKMGANIIQFIFTQ